MSDFEARFRAQLPVIEQGIAQMPADASAQVPGLEKDDVLSFCHSFLPLLERLDEGKSVDLMQIAYGGSNVPEHVINTWTTAAGAAANGIDYFLQNYAATLIDLRNRLEIATGGAAIEGFSTTALKRRFSALEKLLNEANLRIESLDAQREKLSSELASLGESAQRFATEQEALTAITSQVHELREQAEALVQGTGDEDQRSIADIQKGILASATNAENKLKLIVSLQTEANKAALQTVQAKDETIRLQSEAKKTLDDAVKALRGSTQAGLAESFIAERDQKMKGLILYASALAIALIGASVFAVREVLPALSEFTKAIATNGGDVGALSISLTIRTILLAPFVFLAWFAATQYRKIDLLRIDYAAKVAVAKAYVGYKDEVKSDPKLLVALKHYLIQRFGEHPVRLVSQSSDERIPTELFGLESPAPAQSQPSRRTRGQKNQAADA